MKWRREEFWESAIKIDRSMGMGTAYFRTPGQIAGRARKPFGRLSAPINIRGNFMVNQCANPKLWQAAPLPSRGTNFCIRPAGSECTRTGAWGACPPFAALLALRALFGDHGDGANQRYADSSCREIAQDGDGKGGDSSRFARGVNQPPESALDDWPLRSEFDHFPVIRTGERFPTDVGDLFQHLDAVLEVAEAGTLIVSPGNRHFLDFVTPF